RQCDGVSPIRPRPAPGLITLPEEVTRFRGGHAFPRMRFTVVPHTGHAPLAIRMPVLETETSPLKSRFCRHFTQYPLYVSATSTLPLVGRPHPGHILVSVPRAVRRTRHIRPGHAEGLVENADRRARGNWVAQLGYITSYEQPVMKGTQRRSRTVPWWVAGGMPAVRVA